MCKITRAARCTFRHHRLDETARRTCDRTYSLRSTLTKLSHRHGFVNGTNTTERHAVPVFERGVRVLIFENVQVMKWCSSTFLESGEMVSNTKHNVRKLQSHLSPSIWTAFHLFDLRAAVPISMCMCVITFKISLRSTNNTNVRVELKHSKIVLLDKIRKITLRVQTIPSCLARDRRSNLGWC